MFTRLTIWITSASDLSFLNPLNSSKVYQKIDTSTCRNIRGYVVIWTILGFKTSWIMIRYVTWTLNAKLDRTTPCDGLSLGWTTITEVEWFVVGLAKAAVVGGGRRNGFSRYADEKAIWRQKRRIQFHSSGKKNSFWSVEIRREVARVFTTLVVRFLSTESGVDLDRHDDSLFARTPTLRTNKLPNNLRNKQYYSVMTAGVQCCVATAFIISII